MYITGVVIYFSSWSGWMFVCKVLPTYYFTFNKKGKQNCVNRYKMIWYLKKYFCKESFGISIKCIMIAPIILTIRQKKMFIPVNCRNRVSRSVYATFICRLEGTFTFYLIGTHDMVDLVLLSFCLFFNKETTRERDMVTEIGIKRGFIDTLKLH